MNKELKIYNELKTNIETAQSLLVEWKQKQADLTLEVPRLELKLGSKNAALSRAKSIQEIQAVQEEKRNLESLISDSKMLIHSLGVNISEKLTEIESIKIRLNAANESVWLAEAHNMIAEIKDKHSDVLNKLRAARVAHHKGGFKFDLHRFMGEMILDCHPIRIDTDDIERFAPEIEKRIFN